MVHAVAKPVPPVPWPTTMLALDPGERLIVWAFRRWVVGMKTEAGVHWEMVWREFARQFGGADARDALSGFCALVRGLALHARRPIRHHQPCCPCLGPDEVCLIGLVAACQTRHGALARATAGWLVRAQGVAALVDASTQFARAMEAHGMRPRLRMQGPMGIATAGGSSRIGLAVH